ncbi:proline-rich receptor-like protein kinase PERK9 isoform X2 [Hordeum vulgare subsp. vulgare]|nr:proline-rich receptor-like protein kinase PERK9 isoform X2 [Hordeum vulgare subsp. vulgare]
MAASGHVPTIPDLPSGHKATLRPFPNPIRVVPLACPLPVHFARPLAAIAMPPAQTRPPGSPSPATASRRTTIVGFVRSEHQIESRRPVRSPSPSSSSLTTPSTVFDSHRSGPPRSSTSTPPDLR